ncbi:MAG: oxidoreductase [Deltaproteobacteria bacterium]|nr:oxidoreductase [Deltaproteobacteria bacterium]MBN2670937.1 oxidoreductase [Deltaproteobacteria bacterium]
MSDNKPKVAFYWCASCGGCEEAVVDLNEGLLDVAAAVDIVLWPVALDFKYSDVEALRDGDIAVAFVNGAIRTDEQAHIARLLRRKAGLIVAFGSCAHTGGIPGLANLTTKEKIFETSYLKSPTVDNPEKTIPVTKTTVDGVDATLPGFWTQVHTLDQLIDVDYYLPGCPPMPNSIVDAVTAILEGKLPPKGAVIGSKKALCDTCTRTKPVKPTLHERFYLPHEIDVDPEVCFLEQGVICCGPATRGGCGEKCIQGNMPCTGCYGTLDGVTDQGAKLVSAIAAYIDGDSAIEVKKAVATILDPAGTFYRYGVPASQLFKKEAMEVTK